MNISKWQVPLFVQQSGDRTAAVPGRDRTAHRPPQRGEDAIPQREDGKQNNFS